VAKLVDQVPFWPHPRPRPIRAGPGLGCAPGQRPPLRPEKRSSVPGVGTWPAVLSKVCRRRRREWASRWFSRLPETLLARLNFGGGSSEIGTPASQRRITSSWTRPWAGPGGLGIKALLALAETIHPRSIKVLAGAAVPAEHVTWNRCVPSLEQSGFLRLAMPAEVRQGTPAAIAAA